MPGATINPFAIRWARHQSGERMPFLVRRDDGLPIEATVDWIVAQRRTHKQARTLDGDLQHLQSMYLWAEAHAIDLDQRLSSGRFFTDEELRSLFRFCGWRQWRALDEVSESRFLSGRSSGGTRPSDGEKVAPLRPATRPRKESATFAVKRNRIQTAHAFIRFVSGGHERRLSVHGSAEALASYTTQRAACLELIEAEYKSIQTGAASSSRRGLAPDVQDRLRAVIEPDHPENPWEIAVRLRNRLIILMLLDLGIRRGELLALRTEDLRFTADRCFISVHRRPDDRLDPRTAQPTTKTLARELAAGKRLTGLFHDYVTDVRRVLPGAPRHPFLIVDGRVGRPLSLWALNKLFSALRSRVPGLPADLTAHAMRHTWNDRFSEQADKKGVPPEREEKLRKHQMGWSPTSKMAARYTKRHNERTANDLSVEMQDRLGPLEPGPRNGEA